MSDHNRIEAKPDVMVLCPCHLWLELRRPTHSIPNPHAVVRWALRYRHAAPHIGSIRSIGSQRPKTPKPMASALARSLRNEIDGGPSLGEHSAEVEKEPKLGSLKHESHHLFSPSQAASARTLLGIVCFIFRLPYHCNASFGFGRVVRFVSTASEVALPHSILLCFAITVCATEHCEEDQPSFAWRRAFHGPQVHLSRTPGA